MNHTPPTPEERRHFHRVLFDASAWLSFPDRQVPVRVVDISLKGALVEAQDALPEALEPCDLELCLDERAQPCIQMHMEPLHRHGQVLGLRCLNIDVESISHLRRLVELNLGDAQLLERDLQALG